MAFLILEVNKLMVLWKGQVLLHSKASTRSARLHYYMALIIAFNIPLA